MLSRAGRDTSVTAITVPDICAGSSWSITVWTVCTETHFVTMHATGQDAALARLCSPGDRHGHMPMLSGRHLDALEIQEVFLPRRQVIDVERADDFLPVDCIADIDCAL